VGGPLYFNYTKPRIELTPGNPQFPSTKLLGGRVMISDSFARGCNEARWNSFKPSPSDGFRGHRDGYNVLYGDCHSAWYADVEQRLIWWPYNWSHDCDSIAIARWAQYAGSTEPKRGPFPIFHLFDKAAGIDADVNYPMP
jgi:hypothetical protein